MSDTTNDFLDSVKAILDDRGKQYGSVADSFERIASAWSLTLGRDISPTLACQMMLDFKVARLRHDATNEDSMRDIIGYVCCLHELKNNVKQVTRVKGSVVLKC